MNLIKCAVPCVNVYKLISSQTDVTKSFFILQDQVVVLLRRKSGRIVLLDAHGNMGWSDLHCFKDL